MIPALRLRYVQVADFRKSEASNYEEFLHNERELAVTFKGDDCVLFVSESGNQLCFVYGVTEVSEQMLGHTAERKVLASARLRLLNGRWTPALLKHYAEAVGLQLRNVRSFDEIVTQQREARH